jgi:hypothetical protein
MLKADRAAAGRTCKARCCYCAGQGYVPTGLGEYALCPLCRGEVLVERPWPGVFAARLAAAGGPRQALMLLRAEARLADLACRKALDKGDVAAFLEMQQRHLLLLDVCSALEHWTAGESRVTLQRVAIEDWLPQRDTLPTERQSREAPDANG